MIGWGGDVTKSMRLFISGSAPLLAETHTDFHTRTGALYPRTLWYDGNQYDCL